MTTQFETAPSHDPGGKVKPKWPAGSRIFADFSPCGRYRYMLSEEWDGNKPKVMFLMMNPSVAGIEHADPTLIKTGKFARSWGFGGQYVGNIHAYRCTDSRKLADVESPAGPLNDMWILRMAGCCRMVVLAYGKPPKQLQARAAKVVAMLADAGTKLTYLHMCKDGTPGHPLYLKDDSQPIDWRPQ